MELLEPIESINKQLVDHFSVAWNGQPIYRVVWSEDQLEKRLTNYTDSGMMLIVPEIRELPKYRQWLQNKYILERLTIVPEINENEMIDKISYEPIFVFERADGSPLPPKFEACKFVIDSLLAAMGRSSMFPKYIDPMIGDTEEKIAARIKSLKESLFGNETDVTDSLAYHEGIVVPRNYERKQ